MKYLLISLLFIITLFSTAQVKKEPVKKESNDEEFELKNYKSDPNDRLIFEINRTGWLNTPKGISMNWKSIGFNVALMFDKPIGKSNFSVGYGIGLFSHNFHSNADFTSRYDSTKKLNVTDITPKLTSYNVNRFAQKILEIPLELRFRTKTFTKFKVMVGGKFGYVVHDFRKVFDDKGKYKIYDTPNLNYFRYGIVFRIGVEQFCFTASYYFSEVFNKNRSVNGIVPYSLGIAIIPY